MVFRTARVMHAGDAFPNKNVPIMDRNNGGSGVEFPVTLARAAATPGVDRGDHRPQHDDGDRRLEGYGEFIRDLVAAVQDAKKAGRTLDEASPAGKRRIGIGATRRRSRHH